MKQYCRYCAYCQISGLTGGAKCEQQNRELTESYAKKANDCKDYLLVECPDDYKDFFMEQTYRGRKEKPIAEHEQVKLFEEERKSERKNQNTARPYQTV